MKNVMYEKPVMAIARFSGEDVVTTSGNSAGDIAANSLKSSGSELLGGRQALDAASVVQFSF